MPNYPQGRTPKLNAGSAAGPALSVTGRGSKPRPQHTKKLKTWNGSAEAKGSSIYLEPTQFLLLYKDISYLGVVYLLRLAVLWLSSQTKEPRRDLK